MQRPIRPEQQSWRQGEEKKNTTLQRGFFLLFIFSLLLNFCCLIISFQHENRLLDLLVKNEQREHV